VRPSYGAYVLASALMLGMGGSTMSLNGFLVVLCPAFILLAMIRSEAIRQSTAILFVLGLSLETFFFVHALWAG
jgi:hypothetical protein